MLAELLQEPRCTGVLRDRAHHDYQQLIILLGSPAHLCGGTAPHRPWWGVRGLSCKDSVDAIRMCRRPPGTNRTRFLLDAHTERSFPAGTEYGRR